MVLFALGAEIMGATFHFRTRNHGWHFDFGSINLMFVLFANSTLRNIVNFNYLKQNLLWSIRHGFHVGYEHFSSILSVSFHLGRVETMGNTFHFWRLNYGCYFYFRSINLKFSLFSNSIFIKNNIPGKYNFMTYFDVGIQHLTIR